MGQLLKKLVIYKAWMNLKNIILYEEPDKRPHTEIYMKCPEKANLETERRLEMGLGSE